MGKLFADAKKTKKSVGPKGGRVTSGGSPSSARRLWTVASGTVTPISHIPGHIVTTHGDVHRAVQFVPPDWRVGAGTDLERAPLNPVRLLDVRELPEFIGGGPDVQFPCLVLQLDHCRAIDVVASLNGHVHHRLIFAATTTWAKPNVRAVQPIGHATGAESLKVNRKAFKIMLLSCWSG
jgi:hypothetical protein